MKRPPSRRAKPMNSENARLERRAVKATSDRERDSSANPAELEDLLNPDRLNDEDLVVISSVIGMGKGRVLGFSEQSFRSFLRSLNPKQEELYANVQGRSQDERLKALLGASSTHAAADLLMALLGRRERESQTKVAPAERRGYLALVDRLRAATVDTDTRKLGKSAESSAWTGRRTIADHINTIRAIAPRALTELDRVTDALDSTRFNDPDTAEALRCLRELHTALGELLLAADSGSLSATALSALEAGRAQLLTLVRRGAKVVAIAPAWTLGVIYILSELTGCKIDTQLTGSVYAAVLGYEFLESRLDQGVLPVKRMLSGDVDRH